MTRLGILVGTCLAFAAGTAVADEAEDARAAAIAAGKQEYMYGCAGCHGDTGKGTGPIARLIEIETPDLTRITERTGGGEFPVANTLKIIDGRQTIRAHGGTMPVWGDRFMRRAREQEEYSEAPEAANLVTLGRLMALVYYLESIQE